MLEGVVIYSDVYGLPSVRADLHREACWSMLWNWSHGRGTNGGACGSSKSGGHNASLSQAIAVHSIHNFMVFSDRDLWGSSEVARALGSSLVPLVQQVRASGQGGCSKPVVCTHSAGSRVQGPM